VKAYSQRLTPLAVLPSDVNGRPGMVNSTVVPVGRMLFFGSGNYFDGTGAGIHAYILPIGQ
jgi:hypothetical protein